MDKIIETKLDTNDEMVYPYTCDNISGLCDRICLYTFPSRIDIRIVKTSVITAIAIEETVIM